MGVGDQTPADFAPVWSVIEKHLLSKDSPLVFHREGPSPRTDMMPRHFVKLRIVRGSFAHLPKFPLRIYDAKYHYSFFPLSGQFLHPLFVVPSLSGNHGL